MSIWRHISSFGLSLYPLIYYILELILDIFTSAFTFYWVFLIPCFLECLWLTAFWIQHTRVWVLLVYKWLFLWRFIYCHILEFFIGVIKKISIVWRIHFLEWLDDVFVYASIMILLYYIFLLFKIKSLDSLLYVLLRIIVLFGLNVFFCFCIFGIDLVLDRIKFLVSPFIGPVFIL